MNIFRYLALAALLTLGAESVAAQNFEKGLAAAETGDFETALTEWLPLVEQGDAAAQFNLGVMFAKGDGVPQDYAEAAKWFRLAADQGAVGAQSILGSMYAKGEGVPQDYAAAVKWFRLAAEQGDAKAQLRLGLMYANGYGVPQDYAKAHMWYNIATANGAENSAKLRDEVGEKMTTADISKAQAMAGRCLNSGYRDCD